MNTSSPDNPLQDLENRVLRIEEYLFPRGGPTSPSIFVLFQELDTKLASLETRFASQADVDELKRAVAEISEWIEARSDEMTKLAESEVNPAMLEEGEEEQEEKENEGSSKKSSDKRK